MAKGNDQVAQVMAFIGVVLLIIAAIYAFILGSRCAEEDLWGWRLGSKRVLYLFLGAIAFFLGALVWSTVDGKHGGGYCHKGQGGHHGKPSYKATAKPQQYDYTRPFASNTEA